MVLVLTFIKSIRCDWSYDAFEVVLQLFVQDWILPNYNSNVVMLIHKIVDPSKMQYYRPIVLANFKFKIITKVIVDRLTTIMA